MSTTTARTPSGAAASRGPSASLQNHLHPSPAAIPQPLIRSPSIISLQQCCLNRIPHQATCGARLFSLSIISGDAPRMPRVSRVLDIAESCSPAWTCRLTGCPWRPPGGCGSRAARSCRGFCVNAASISGTNAESRGNCMLGFIRNCQTVFRGSRPISAPSPSRQQPARVRVPGSPQHLAPSPRYIVAFLTGVGTTSPWPPRPEQAAVWAVRVASSVRCGCRIRSVL